MGTRIHHLLLGVLAACGRIGFDQNGGETNGATITTDSSGAVCTGIAMCPGPSFTLGPGDMINYLSNASSDRNLEGSCGGNPGFEATFEVRIQRSGRFVFHLTAAAARVLYVRDACCAGPELGCSAALLPKVKLDLEENQVVVVIVDGAVSNEYLSLYAEGAMSD
jgi:hypothetical protein